MENPGSASLELGAGYHFSKWKAMVKLGLRQWTVKIIE